MALALTSVIFRFGLALRPYERRFDSRAVFCAITLRRSLLTIQKKTITTNGDKDDTR